MRRRRRRRGHGHEEACCDSPRDPPTGTLHGSPPWEPPMGTLQGTPPWDPLHEDPSMGTIHGSPSRDTSMGLRHGHPPWDVPWDPLHEPSEPHEGAPHDGAPLSPLSTGIRRMRRAGSASRGPFAPGQSTQRMRRAGSAPRGPSGSHTHPRRGRAFHDGRGVPPYPHGPSDTAHPLQGRAQGGGTQGTSGGGANDPFPYAPLTGPQPEPEG